MNNFKNKCSKCGLCCKHAGQVTGFPEETDEKGCCVHLKDNKCSIYENRPLICRVDDFYEVVKSKFENKDQYIAMNITVCNTLIRQNKLDDKFLITE
jgi:Fe-S-cluster containining protein